jgi:ABC-type phosphate transport system substrate-binding protein
VSTSAKRRIGVALGVACVLASLTPALADVVPVVSAKSSIDHLSRKDLTDIFLGRTARSPDGAPVVPVDQDEGSTTRDEFYTTFLGKTPAQLRAYWSKIIFTGRGKPPSSVPGGVEARKLVAMNPHAIAYVDRNQLDKTVKPVRID